jgi:hypothetical protein
VTLNHLLASAAARAVQVTPPAHALPGSENSNAATKKDANNPRKVRQQEDLNTDRIYLSPMDRNLVVTFVVRPPERDTKLTTDYSLEKSS